MKSSAALSGTALGHLSALPPLARFGIRRPLFVYGVAPLRRALRAVHERPPVHPRALERYQVPGTDTFFGYYDVSPLSEDRSRLLALAVPEGILDATPAVPARIGYFDRDADGRFVELDTTLSWCWQMGCRLRFLPGSGGTAVVYNKPHAGRPGARILDLAGASESRPLPFPLYDIAPSGAFGLFLDFGRLGWLRPGYGYPPFEERSPAHAPADSGIWRGDLADGTSELIVSLARVAALEPEPDMAGAYHYFNHIAIDPTGTRFFFLHLWTRSPGGRAWRGRMLTAGCDGTDLRLIAGKGRPSHYCWRDAHHLVVTLVDPASGRASYRLIADGRGDRGVLWPHLPAVDGHPSLSADGARLLTDTYPDRYNEQRLLIVEKSGATHELGRFRPALDASGARRCDLHPRWAADERMVIFDSTHDRGRAVYVMACPTAAPKEPA